jgi:hypothetical protein
LHLSTFHLPSVTPLARTILSGLFPSQEDEDIPCSSQKIPLVNSSQSGNSMRDYLGHLNTLFILPPPSLELSTLEVLATRDMN